MENGGMIRDVDMERWCLLWEIVSLATGEMTNGTNNSLFDLHAIIIIIIIIIMYRNGRGVYIHWDDGQRYEGLYKNGTLPFCEMKKFSFLLL